jgi:hypothetical protein
MTEQDGKDSKVIRLFPAKGDRAPDNLADGDAGQPTAADPKAIEVKIAGLLGEAEPLPPPPPPGPKAPPPGHRNAVMCSQCDQYTWRETRRCIHCGADLLAHAQARAYRRRRRWAIAGRCIIVGSWFVAAGCIYAMNHYYRVLPPKVRGAMFITVLCIVGVNLFLLWMNSEDNRRR